jgi:hypothetical protein
LLEPEDEGVMILQNFGDVSPSDTAAEGVSFQQQHCENLKSSTIQYLLTPWSRVLLEKLTGSATIQYTYI